MINRKKFIKTFLRIIFLVGIALISGILIFRKQNENSEICNLDFVCKNCKKLKSCTIPEAVNFKNKI